MEPPQAEVRTRWSFFTTIEKVEEGFKHHHTGGVGSFATFVKVSLGWFVYMEGSHEALHLGAEKPELAKGDRVKITLEKV